MEIAVQISMAVDEGGTYGVGVVGLLIPEGRLPNRCQELVEDLF